MQPTDKLNRPLRDLRISVTDRCNFRCVYCMPKEIFGSDFAFLPHDKLLSFEEITRLTKLFVANGVEKIRITGGEPLLRKGVEMLIKQLSEINGIKDLAMTTNASLLRPRAERLKQAGLHRVSVSLDSLDDNVFMTMNDVRFPVSKVLDGIKAAEDVGLTPIKINAVIKRGMNDDSILKMAEHFRNTGHILRFIEFMDVGNSNGWRLEDTVTTEEIFKTIHSEWPLLPIDQNYEGEVANRFRYKDKAGEIGIIASISQPFCHGCTRSRLSAEGKLYTCLFSGLGHDFRDKLRRRQSDHEIDMFIKHIWGNRKDRYSELRTEETNFQTKVEMSHIGG